MIGLFLYISVGFLAATVLSNRYWKRQIGLLNRDNNKYTETCNSVQEEIRVLASEKSKLESKIAQEKSRIESADLRLHHALKDLASAEALPGRSIFVFDRLAARPGRFWEVSVKCAADARDDEALNQGWSGTRTYLIVADTEREAIKRVSSRFMTSSGFIVEKAQLCRIDGLTLGNFLGTAASSIPQCADTA